MPSVYRFLLFPSLALVSTFFSLNSLVDLARKDFGPHFSADVWVVDAWLNETTTRSFSYFCCWSACPHYFTTVLVVQKLPLYTMEGSIPTCESWFAQSGGN